MTTDRTNGWLVKHLPGLARYAATALVTAASTAFAVGVYFQDKMARLDSAETALKDSIADRAKLHNEIAAHEKESQKATEAFASDNAAAHADIKIKLAGIESDLKWLVKQSGKVANGN